MISEAGGEGEQSRESVDEYEERGLSGVGEREYTRGGLGRAKMFLIPKQPAEEKRRSG